MPSTGWCPGFAGRNSLTTTGIPAFLMRTKEGMIARESAGHTTIASGWVLIAWLTCCA